MILSRCHDCNFNRDGIPLCKLPSLIDPKYNHPFVRNIQIDGCSAVECLNKRRDEQLREYDLMIIGEAPGGTEDDMGMPFVGDAGDVLMEFIERSGIDPDKTYVTNMVKCRPPKNRKPAREELNACRVHIDHEIKTIKPKIIMLLGNVATKLFNLQGGIGTIHGQMFTKSLPSWEDGPEFTVIPSWHPAFFLHKPSPAMRNLALDDYIFVRSLMTTGAESRKFYKAKYELCDTVEKVKKAVGFFKKFNIFSWDTESRGLGITREPMIMTQLSRGIGHTYIVPFYRHDAEAVDEWKLKPQWSNEDRDIVINLLKSIFEDKNIAKIGHNTKYDINVLKYHCNIDTNGFLWDTHLIHHLLEPRSVHKLEMICDIEFRTGDWSEDINKFVGVGKDKKSYDNIPDDDFYQYAATDAEMTFRLMSDKLYDRIMNKPSLYNLYLEETHPVIRAISKGELTGNKLKREEIDKLAIEYDQNLLDITARCRELTKPDFNPGSPAQVKDALVELGFADQVLDATASSGFSTGKDVLSDIAHEHELIQKILDYRTIKKLRSTYVDRAISDIDLDGRIRVSFNLGGTVSGRYSCRFLHQIPRIDKDRVKAGKPILRDIFGEDDGYYYFYADYSQIELRIFSVLTGEEAFLKMLADPDADFHRLTASGALGIPFELVSSFNRNEVGKRMNFGIIYGSEGYSLSKYLYEDQATGQKKVIGLDRAKYMVRHLHSTCPKIKEFIDDVEIQANARGNKLESVFGRELDFPELAASNTYLRGEAKRQAVNFKVQSPAASIATRTINLVDAWMEKEKITTKEIRFLNTVHDSIAYGVHRDLIDTFPAVFKKIAERPIPQLKNYSFLVKMGHSDISWTDAEMKAA